jgi:hypothetical protein
MVHATSRTVTQPVQDPIGVTMRAHDTSSCVEEAPSLILPTLHVVAVVVAVVAVVDLVGQHNGLVLLAESSDLVCRQYAVYLEVDSRIANQTSSNRVLESSIPHS